ncbi:extracellular solute-binding protein [Hasllibacter halocynthiae]|nr:extracellular solute-binding protein [Hasllibacter halocynthiae]
MITRARKPVLALALTLPGAAFADGHGIAMYGEPALPPDFAHLPYANPDAPKGGRIVTGEAGGFDSLNPFILGGNVPWNLRYLTSEGLMGRSWDEPFTLYGLLAERVETAPDRSWVEFTLRPEAAFSDGTPVTVEDVIWSYETLGTEGHPRYRGLWESIENIEATDDRTVRITFSEENPELALISGLRPILQRAQWEGRDFGESPLEPPIATAPYVVDDFEPGRFISLRRNPDYWGADVPFMQGQANFDEVRLEFFGDGAVVFEAFKAGELTTHREFNAAVWNSQYDFPAVERGEVILEEVPHRRPSGMTGFVMNTRKPPFDDWRVREAMIQAFNFEFINEAINSGDIPRITSYFSNSDLGMREGPAEDMVADLLGPFADELLPGAIDGYALPVGDGSERNRAGVRAALGLLEEAGWVPGDDGVLRNEAGEPFRFEILLQQGATETQQITDIYVQALARLGITPTVTTVDQAQYNQRTGSYDFDMTYYRVGLSLSPGNEQYRYWGSEDAALEGGRNWAGIEDPAVDAMIDAILSSQSREEFLAATRALDRALMAGRYFVPVWQWNISRLAYYDTVAHPDYVPIYGDWIGWQPDVWWSTEAQ